MKKSFLTFVLLTMVLSTFAQLPITIDIGIKAGINTSQITSTNPSVIDVKSKSGWDIGALARLGGKSIFLQPELLYVEKQGLVTFTTITGTNTHFVSIKSVKIPILVGFKLINHKHSSVYSFTGPARLIAVGDNYVSSVFSQPYICMQETFNVWDWQLGGGVDLGPLTLDVRYECGISEIKNKNFYYGNIGFKEKGNFLTFSLGFKFTLFRIR